MIWYRALATALGRREEPLGRNKRTATKVNSSCIVTNMHPESKMLMSTCFDEHHHYRGVESLQLHVLQTMEKP